MKYAGLLMILGLVFLSAVGCSTTPNPEKETYFEDGKMDDQVQSWKKHGRY